MPRLLALLICLFAIAAVPVSARPEPLPAPLSPETLAALPPSLRDNPRAFAGGVAIGSVDTYGCGDGGLKLNVAFLMPSTAGSFLLWTTATQGIDVFMRARHTISFDSGVYVRTINSDNSEGPVSGDYPLDSTAVVTVRMLLATIDGEPLWYTDAQLVCDGTPPGVFLRDSEVTALALNPSFDTPGATGSTASKWTLGTRVKRSCGAIPGDCVLKMKTKVDKTAVATQRRKYKNNPLGETGDPFGFVFMYDGSSDALARLQTDLILEYPDEVPATEINYFTNVAAFELRRTRTYGLVDASVLLAPIKTATMRMALQNSLTNEQTGTVYIRGIYAWVATNLE